MPYRKNPENKIQDDLESVAGTMGGVVRVPTIMGDIHGIGNPTGAGVNIVQRQEGQITAKSDRYGKDIGVAGKPGNVKA